MNILQSVCICLCVCVCSSWYWWISGCHSRRLWSRGPFPTSYFPPSSLLGACLNVPLLLPINIPLGRPELVGSLGAETPPSTPGRAGWGRAKERTEIKASEERVSVGMCERGLESEERKQAGSERKRRWSKNEKQGWRSWRRTGCGDLSQTEIHLTLRQEKKQYSHCLLLKDVELMNVILLLTFPLFLFFSFPSHPQCVGTLPWIPSLLLMAASLWEIHLQTVFSHKQSFPDHWLTAWRCSQSSLLSTL